MCVCVCLQTALLFGYGGGGGGGQYASCAPGASHRAFAGEPHFLQATVKAVYSVSYLLLDRKCAMVGHVQKWLRNWTHWDGDRYTSWTPKACADLRAYEVVWNDDWEVLDGVRRQSCPGAGCVCVCPRPR